MSPGDDTTELMMQRANFLAPALTLLALTACGVSVHNIGDDPPETGEGSGETNDVPLDVGGDGSATGGPGDETGTTGTSDGTGTTGDPTGRDLDVLFVVDNSGSMAPHQRAMVPAVVAMVERLDQLGADYRLGFTTTDDGNPWCDASATDAGRLVLSSCTDRISDFTSQSGADAVQFACVDHCGASSAELGLNGAEHPWLEQNDGENSLAPGVSVAEAVSCVFPQGIDGCGFESSLTSMRKSLLRSQDLADPAYGFIRDDANLLVVLITDEMDCSDTEDGESIFDPNGNRVFWHPDAGDTPTSAICWNAGTRCEGSGDSLNCEWQNYDIDGDELSPQEEDASVLHPPGVYASILSDFRDQKQSLNPGAQVELAVVAGYGTGGNLSFNLSTDPDFMRDFGTGPGCTVAVPGLVSCVSDADCAGIHTGICTGAGTCLDEVTAIPPVRAEAVRATGESPYKISICSNDWVSRFELIAEEMTQ